MTCLTKMILNFHLGIKYSKAYIFISLIFTSHNFFKSSTNSKHRILMIIPGKLCNLLARFSSAKFRCPIGKIEIHS